MSDGVLIRVNVPIRNEDQARSCDAVIVIVIVMMRWLCVSYVRYISFFSYYCNCSISERKDMLIVLLAVSAILLYYC